MPELPEVETIRRGLRDGGAGYPSLVGEVISSAQVLWARTLALPDVAQFCARLPGQAISDFGRRGKFLIVYLTQDALLVHLRMSGDLRVESQQQALAPHHRLVLNFADGLRLAFNDPRKFGRVWLTAQPEELLAGLGPEPLDGAFTAQDLAARVRKRTAPIKAVLLDQTVVAGLGNIYADEVLFAARIDPRRPANSLEHGEMLRLHAAFRSVLTEAIRACGSSLRNYRPPLTARGRFQEQFQVFRRTGEPCRICGAPIERIRLAQRSTHFCPVCQR